MVIVAAGCLRFQPKTSREAELARACSEQPGQAEPCHRLGDELMRRCAWSDARTFYKKACSREDSHACIAAEDISAGRTPDACVATYPWRSTGVVGDGAPSAPPRRALLVACPSEEDLLQLLWDVFPQSLGDFTERAIMGCTPGRFPEPAWFLGVLWEDGEGRMLLLTPGGTALAAGDMPNALGRGGMDTPSAIDLDGDGVDEIQFVFDDGSSHPMPDEGGPELVTIRVVGRSLRWSSEPQD